MKRTVTYLTRKPPIAATTAIALVCIASLSAAGPETSTSRPGTTAPATVENRVTEADLTTITLTRQAVERLAIKTMKSREGKLARQRFHGGETMAPPGRAIQLVAPFAGTLLHNNSAPTPTTGSLLKKGELILKLQPSVMSDREVLAPSERIALARAAADFETAQAQAEGEVNAARVQLEAARVRLERATRLREQNATSVKLLDEANAEHELAQAQLKAAQANASAWRRAGQGVHADPLLALELVAPFEGVLMDLTVASGEVVSANAPVARVVSLDPLWIRVRAYIGELNILNLEGAVRVGGLDGRPDPDMQVVKPIGGPPTADAMSSSIDLYFQIQNPSGTYRPGQRVGVWIPLRESTGGVIIPWSAVLYDHHGGTWVYEQIQPLQFTRRRVQLESIEDGSAMISLGLRPGANVVTDGAAELFGVEFGAGK